MHNRKPFNATASISFFIRLPSACRYTTIGRYRIKIKRKTRCMPWIPIVYVTNTNARSYKKVGRKQPPIFASRGANLVRCITSSSHRGCDLPLPPPAMGRVVLRFAGQERRVVSPLGHQSDRITWSYSPVFVPIEQIQVSKNELFLWCFFLESVFTGL